MSETPKRKPPAFQFYADDFLSGTLDMSQEEVGAYIRLLCWQWNRGSIPVATAVQQRLAGGSVSDSVLAKFERCADGELRNRRLESVRKERLAFQAKQAEKGRKSARERNRGSTVVPTVVPTAVGTVVATAGVTGAQPEGQPESNSPSPTPSPCIITHIEEPREVELPPGFPKTAQEAVERAGMAGVAKDVAEDAWLMATSRGGRDSKGQPILNWASHVAICAKWAAGRTAEDKAQKARQGVSVAQTGQGSVWQIKTRLEAAEAEIKAIKNRGHEDAWGWKPKNAEDAAELKRLKKVASDLRKQLAG